MEYTDVEKNRGLDEQKKEDFPPPASRPDSLKGARVLKGVQSVFGVVCLGCAAPPRHPTTTWLIVVVVASLLFTLLWFFCRKIDKFKSVPWVKVEFCCDGCLCFLYLTAFVMQLATWSDRSYYEGRNLAAGYFAMFNFLAFCGSTFLDYAKWRKAHPAQITVIHIHRFAN